MRKTLFILVLAVGIMYAVSADFAPGTVTTKTTKQSYLPAGPSEMPLSWFTKAAHPTTRAHCMVSDVIEVDGVKKYYLFGGPTYSGGSYTTDCYEYNTATDVWTQKAAMPTARGIGRAVVVGDSIYVIGGCVSFGTGLTTVEIYRPSNNTWETGPSLPVGNHDFWAGVYHNPSDNIKYIYVCGGGNWSASSPPTNAVYVLNTATGVWSSATSLPVAIGCPAGGIAGDKIIIATGYIGTAGSNNVYVGTINSANPTQITWTTGTAKPGTVVYRANSGVYNNEVYVVGGNGPSAQTNECYKYNPNTDAWTQMPNMPTARSNVYGLAADPAGFLYYPCGYNQSMSPTYLTVHEMLDARVFPNDVGVEAIISPPTVVSLRNPIIPVKARIKNYGSNPANNFWVRCSIFGTGGALRYWDEFQVTTEIAPGDTRTITFTNWTPTVTEICTIKFRTFLSGDEDPNNDAMLRQSQVVPAYTTGGPDAGYYWWIDSDAPGGPTYNWIDISATGTDLPLTSGTWDDGYCKIPIGFNFTFYDNTYDTVYVGTNGFLSFGTGSTSLGNTNIPNSATPNNLICALWDDLHCGHLNSIRKYQVLGTSPNCTLVISFNNIRYYGAGDSCLAFQYLLFEGSNDIVIQY
ncbi:MAG: kelch repeat-containing protein, partial [candidate division WOR-3 bacterium]